MMYIGQLKEANVKIILKWMQTARLFFLDPGFIFFEDKTTKTTNFWSQLLLF